MVHRWMARLAGVATLGLAVGVGIAQASAQQRQAQPRAEVPGRSVIVHLTKSTNENPHAVFMALSLANALQQAGGSVTLFLDLEGVRLADRRSPEEFRMGTTSAAELYANFVDAGGRVAICSHCMHIAGMEQSALRRGATMVNEQTLGRMLMSADRIIDY